MVYQMEVQIGLSKKAIEMEEKRIKNWKNDFKLKEKRARDRIKIMQNKINLLQNRLNDVEKLKSSDKKC